MPAVAHTATHQPAAASPRRQRLDRAEQLGGRRLAAAERGRHAEPVEPGRRELGGELRRPPLPLAPRRELRAGRCSARAASTGAARGRRALARAVASLVARTSALPGARGR